MCMNSNITGWEAFRVLSDRHPGACLGARDPHTKCEVRGHDCPEMSLILVASLGLAQKLGLATTRKPVESLLLSLTDKREIPW